MTPALVKARLAARARDGVARVTALPRVEPTPPAGERVAAAVLIALIGQAHGLNVVLTRRSDSLPHHAGQVSFPGGRVEPSDGSPEEAALREAEEEIGLPRGQVSVLGRLAEYVTLSGYAITPVVGLVEAPFRARPDPAEVAEVFEMPLAFVLDPANHLLVERSRDGRRRYTYALPYGDHQIWGATAGMLVNLYEVLTGR